MLSFEKTNLKLVMYVLIELEYCYLLFYLFINTFTQQFILFIFKICIFSTIF